MSVEPDKLHVASLELIVRRFENALRDLRTLRTELEASSQDKGVLGSRGLTQFIIGLLQQGAYTVTELLTTAESAGYEPTTKRTMTKRLTERAYRTGDIAFDPGSAKWFWKGTQ